MKWDHINSASATLTLNGVALNGTLERYKALLAPEGLFAEVKRNKNKIVIERVSEKSKNLQTKFQDYTFEFHGFSLEDM